MRNTIASVASTGMNVTSQFVSQQINNVAYKKAQLTKEQEVTASLTADDGYTTPTREEKTNGDVKLVSWNASKDKRIEVVISRDGRTTTEHVSNYWGTEQKSITETREGMIIRQAFAEDISMGPNGTVQATFKDDIPSLVETSETVVYNANKSISSETVTTTDAVGIEYSTKFVKDPITGKTTNVYVSESMAGKVWGDFFGETLTYNTDGNISFDDLIDTVNFNGGDVSYREVSTGDVILGDDFEAYVAEHGWGNVRVNIAGQELQSQTALTSKEGLWLGDFALSQSADYVDTKIDLKLASFLGTPQDSGWWIALSGTTHTVADIAKGMTTDLLRFGEGTALAMNAFDMKNHYWQEGNYSAALGSFAEGVGHLSADAGRLFIVGSVARGVASAAKPKINTLPAVRQQGRFFIGDHAAGRMVKRGITERMIDTAIAKGKAYWDPKHNTVNYILKEGFASGKSLLVGQNPITGKITTVIRMSKSQLLTQMRRLISWR